MNVLFHNHWEWKYRRAGSEKYSYELAQFLLSKGHKVKFLVNPDMRKYSGGQDTYTNNGAEVHVSPATEAEAAPLEESLYKWADIVLTHLNCTRRALNLGKKYGVPVVNVTHCDGQVPLYEIKPEEVALSVYNSEWLRTRVEREFHSRETHVLIPPFNADEYDCPNTEKRYITHLNCNKGKGVMYSRHYASMTPEYDYLFVLGSYFQQFIPKGTHEQFKHLNIEMREVDFPENCIFHPISKNVVADVYSKTKVFLAPSSIDTWGYAVCEAMASGIPVICHPDPGFLESAGRAGLFVERQNAKVVVDLITKLMENEAFYNERSALCYQRAREIDALGKQQMLELESKLVKVATDYRSGRS